jgi:hypothetical protein
MKAPGIQCYVAGSIPAVTPRYCTKKIELFGALHKKQRKKNYFICSGALGGIIVPVPVSETTVHDNSASSSAATNTVIVFAAALESR